MQKEFSSSGFKFLMIETELWDDGIGFNKWQKGYRTIII